MACDYCGAHISKKYVLVNNNPSMPSIPLINIPKKSLQTMNPNTLNYIKKNASDGILFCNSCKELCTYNINSCRMNLNTGIGTKSLPTRDVQNLVYNDNSALNYRLKLDKEVIKNINDEEMRRNNLIHNAIQSGTFKFPEIPKIEPQ